MDGRVEARVGRGGFQPSWVRDERASGYGLAGIDGAQALSDNVRS